MASILDDIRNEFAKTNNTVIKLILVNVLVFLGLLVLQLAFYLSQNEAFYDSLMRQFVLSANVNTFLHKPWTFVTNFWVHTNIWHIVFNMLFLYWFGQVLEEYIGSRRLVSIYILGGIVGSVFFLLIYNLVPYFQPNLANATVLGASGAIFAVIVGAATLLPDYTFFIFLLGPVRIKYIAAFYVVLSMIELLGANAGGNLAHLAGAVVGYSYIKMLRQGHDMGSPIISILDTVEALFSKQPQKPKMSERRPAPTTASVYSQSSYSQQNAATSSPSDTPDQEEIDMILDKISKSGYDSLSRDEKQTLYRASQQE